MESPGGNFLALLEVKGFMVHHQVYYEAKLNFFLGFSEFILVLYFERVF